MDFSTKLAITRAYTVGNQNGVDAQEVYDEAILQALQGISPTGANTNTASSIVAVATGSVIAGYVSVSFVTSSTFSGTILGSTIGANTTINITAETGATLTAMNYTITTGSITIITLQRP